MLYCQLKHSRGWPGKVQFAQFDKPGIPGIEIIKSNNYFKVLKILILRMKDQRHVGNSVLIHHFVNIIDTL